MTRIARSVTVAVAAVASFAVPAHAQRGDSQIRREIIRESIAAYPGSCPCPYSVDRAGRTCGRRSAYSRPGGYAPKCYPADVSDSEVRARPGR